jgi:colanic acid biosynthesis protein WcaH
MTRYLPKDVYKIIVKYSNVFALDIIIKNNKKQILLGKRINSPAKGFWFVPGGRVLKNEKLIKAFKRILKSETGISITSPQFFLHGLYDHFYKNNAFGNANINSHYIVAACCVDIDDDFTIKLDQQHSEIAFWDVDSILKSPEVHEYTKNYFIDDAANKFI